MQSALAREGYQLLVASHEMNPAAETEAVRTLLTRGVDGLMLVGAERSQDAALLLRTAGVPVVLSWVGAPDCAAVTVDNRLAGHLAARHLIGLGHRRIGMVVGHLPFNDRQQARLAGARQALHEACRAAGCAADLQTTEALGWPVQEVEAAAFAWLAYCCVSGQAGNLPRVTGARGPRILGSITRGVGALGA
jgi:DNA-binding LacI/PurR family transcriptional regulator